MRRIHVIVVAAAMSGALLAAGIGAYVALKDNDYDFAWVRSPEYLFQMRIYEDVVIQRYEPRENAIYALMYFRPIRDFLLVKLTLSPSFGMARQDAIVVDDVIVGATEIRTASTTDLALGTRAAAVLRLTKDGSYLVDYLLIGDPFPRP